MIQIKIDGNNRVETYNYENEKKEGWIEIDSIPKPEQKEGYIPVMYYRDGKIVYEYEPIPKVPEEEESIEELKRKKIEDLNSYYDTEGANGVNEFFVNTVSLWLLPELRGNVARQIDANILLGNPTTDLPINGAVVPIPNDTAKTMLAKLELYAGECYNVREKKEREISAFATKQEVEDYDVTSDYPEKLKFELI